MDIFSEIITNKFLDPSFYFNTGVDYYSKTSSFFTKGGFLDALYLYHIILFFLASFFLCIIFYTVIRLFEIRKKEHAHMHHEVEEYAHMKKMEEEKNQKAESISKNPRWRKVLEFLFSAHEGDNKLAIIEADSMLEDLLDSMGFKGDSLGEKLKNTTPERFRKLTQAWDVHTIRNKIAHEGSDFQISPKEAQRVIAIYEDIFRDYDFI